MLKRQKNGGHSLEETNCYICRIMILVTGGTGLVGAHLLWHLLQKGANVRAIHRKGSDLEQVREVFSYYADDAASGEDHGSLFNRIEWCPADLMDFYSLNQAMEGISHVYHCAAVVSFNPAERKKIIEDNIKSTAAIVNICLELGVKKLCHVSSVSALGRSYNGVAVTENDNWKPSVNRSGYSISKFHSEMEVWRGVFEGLDAVIVNPSVILGPGNWKRGSARFFTAISKGMKYYTEGMTGFVDVRDVCRCMIHLMDSDISGERFILNSENIYYRDLLNMIADGLGKPQPATPVSRKLAETLWRLDWLRSKVTFSKPYLTKETARSGRSISRFSNQKITETLGHRFIPVKETVQWTASAFKKMRGH
jgi:dihydroflavonol-4-reductase